MRQLKIGGFYKHFKGGIYQVIELAKHTEDNSSLVIYRSTENGQVFARPLDMFMSEVDTEKYPEATQTYRLEEYETEESEVAVMPSDFEKWRVLDIRKTIPRSALSQEMPFAVNYLLGELASELLSNPFIPVTSTKIGNDDEELRVRIPVGPWISMLK